jgi:sugar phosphate isomerase/epimerase
LLGPKIGLSMLYCLGEPFCKMIKRLATVETSYVEIVDDGIHALDKERVRALKQVAKSYDLAYTLHSPFADVNISSPSKPLLSAMIRRLKQSMEFASDLNATVWVLHPGLQTGISMFYPGKDWKQNVQSIKELYATAEDYGVNVAIENLPEKYGFVMKTAEDFLKFYRETRLDVGIVLDVGHANLHNQIYPFLNALADKIVHIHASDNMGETDQHLGIGQGNIDWQQFAEALKKIEYSKTIVTESTDHVEESLSKLKRLFA